MNMPNYNLQRFLDAQQSDYEQALTEVGNGRKYSHWVLQLKNKTAQEVFGSLDAMKVLSCMTLFNEVASDDLFQQVIDRYYQGKVDETTKRKLEK